MLAYDLSAIVGFESVLKSFNERFKALRTAPLAEGLALIPVTKELIKEFEDDFELPVNVVMPEFNGSPMPRKLTKQVAAFIQDSSSFGPLAYLEASYADGVGQQLALVWQAQRIILGPTCTRWGYFGDPLNKIRVEEMAINCALRRLGVKPQRGKDEFEIVGLGKMKRTEDWC